MDIENLTVDEIRAQMREIRRDLPVNVHGIVVNAGQMFDWKNYVRSFPWLAVGGAALIGYLLVPRRRPAVIPQQTQDALEKMAERIEVVAAPVESRKTKTLVGAILPIVSGVVLRLGTAYLTRVGSGLLNRMMHAEEYASASRSRGDGHAAEAPRVRRNYPR